MASVGGRVAGGVSVAPSRSGRGRRQRLWSVRRRPGLRTNTWSGPRLWVKRGDMVLESCKAAALTGCVENAQPSGSFLGGEEALPTPAGPKRQAVRSHTQHTPSQMATAACFDNGNARLCTRPGPSRFAQCVRPPRPAAAHLQICWPGPHHTYALSDCRQLSSVVSWLQVRAPCSSSRPLIRALFARLRPLPGRAPPPTSLW